MDNAMKLISRFRELRTSFSIDLPISPVRISGLSVILSFGVFWNPVAALFVVLLLDLLDGLVARAKGIASHDGMLTDYACDRYSEFIIFGFFAINNPPIILLPVLNTMLAFMVIKKSRVYILPMRQLLLLYLLIF